MKKLRVTVEGKTYEVTVETVGETPAAILPVAAPVVVAAAPVVIAPPPQAAAAPVAAPAPAAAPKPAAAGAKDIVSPLAGKVVSIDAAPGSTVAAGAKVITIEAMKMNTEVFAEVAGTIAKIHVAPGDGVSEGQVLVSLA